MKIPDFFFDVCSINGKSSAKVTVFLTRVHPDRIPAETCLEMHVDPDAVKILEKKYSFLWRERVGEHRLDIEVKEHKNTFKTQCVAWDAERGFYSDFSWGFVAAVGEDVFMVIPESIYAGKLLQRARFEGFTPVFYRQIEALSISKKPITHKDLSDGFFVDTRSRRKYAENVIPRRLPSLYEVKINPHLFKGNPLLEYLVTL